MKATKSIVLRGAKEQLFFLALATVSLFGAGSTIAFAKMIGLRTFSPKSAG